MSGTLILRSPFSEQLSIPMNEAASVVHPRSTCWVKQKSHFVVALLIPKHFLFCIAALSSLFVHVVRNIEPNQCKQRAVHTTHIVRTRSMYIMFTSIRKCNANQRMGECAVSVLGTETNVANGSDSMTLVYSSYNSIRSPEHNSYATRIFLLYDGK